MKTILLTLTYLVGAGELILAIYFWATHSKSEIRKVMALLTMSTGLWVITSALIAYKSSSTINNFINALVFCFGILLITSLLHLFLLYPYRIKNLDRLHITLLYVPVVIFSIAAIFTKSISSGSIATPTFTGAVIPGPLYPVYNIFLLALFITAMVLAIYRLKGSDGSNKKNLIIIIISIIIGGLPAIYYDLLEYFINPAMKGNFLWGAIGTVVWMGATTYIIIKK